MKTHLTVTGVVKHKDKILILHRQKDDYNYPDKWSFCSGFVKEFEPAEKSVLREIKEETGLSCKITKTGKVVEVLDRRNAKRWIVACYLCKAKTTKVKLCSENIDFRWVTLKELKNYKFVPGLTKDLDVLGLK